LDAALLAPAKKIRVWVFGILSFCLYSRVSNGLFENFGRNEMMGLARDFWTGRLGSLFFIEFLFPPSTTVSDYEIENVLGCWKMFFPM
jgi:hypothetical protein